ncbi:zinc finger, SWIM-type containing protein, partial [Tanacetum coccineum]
NKVLRSLEDGLVDCTCRHFLRYGFLCRHVFCVLKNRDIDVIPEKYILRRWRRDIIPPTLRRNTNKYGEKNETVKKLTNEATSVLDKCLFLLSKNEDKLAKFVEQLKTIKKEVVAQMPKPPSQKTKDVIEDFYADEKLKQNQVNNPQGAINKGGLRGECKKVDSRAKVQSPKTRNKNKTVEPKSHTQKPGRQIAIGQRFSPKKSSAVHEKPNTPRSCLRWKPMGRIFKIAGLRPRSSSIDDVCSYQFRPCSSSIDDVCSHQPRSLKEKKSVRFSALYLQKKRNLLVFDHSHQHSSYFPMLTQPFSGSTLGPGPHLLTPRTISSGLVPQPPSPTPNLPPTKNDWGSLFCPMFDEYFNPSPSVVQPVLVAVVQEPVVSTGTPSSTRIDQDTPSTSTSQTTQEEQSHVIPTSVEEDDHAIEVAHMDNDLLMKVILDEEGVAVDDIPLTTKPPSIVDWKIKLVKAKHGYARLEEGYERVLWGDLKTMFEHHVENAVWRNLRESKVLVWKLFEPCGVHFVRFQNLHVFMLVGKRYPLTPTTITDMLNKKL